MVYLTAGRNWFCCTIVGERLGTNLVISDLVIMVIADERVVMKWFCRRFV